MNSVDPLHPSSIQLDELKVRMYKMGLGIASVVLTLLLVQTALTGPLNPEEQFLFPFVLFFCLGSLVLFQFFDRRFLAIFEALVYGLIFFYNLTHFLIGINYARQTNTPIDFDRFLIWLPVIYAVAFLYFSTRRALLASGIFWLSLALPAGYHLWYVRSLPTFAEDFAMLLSILASGPVFCTLFFTLATLKEKYTEAISVARMMSVRADFDHLTQIYSRAKSFEVLNWHLEARAISDLPISILMLDMDNLKRINDERGHTAGDDALRHVAATIRQCLRRSDAVGRIGGDEFLVICPLTEAREAERLVARLEHTIASLPTPYGTLSISSGAATWQPGDTAKSLLHRADEAMYHHKQQKKTAKSQHTL